MDPVYNNKIFIGEQNPAAITQAKQAGKPAKAFDKVFQETLRAQEPVKFSKHASMRLTARNISLSQGQMDRLAEGLEKAREKGIRDSLVLVDNIALVVNTQSKTVITAMNNNTENVYTNIDGAVIV